LEKNLESLKVTNLKVIDNYENLKIRLAALIKRFKSGETIDFLIDPKIEPKLYNNLKDVKTVEQFKSIFNSFFSEIKVAFLNFQKNQNKLKSEIQGHKMSFDKFVKSIIIGITFKDYDLFFWNFFCFRLRFYPGNYLIGRTSGSFKYLIDSKEAIILTDEGLKNLIISFLSNCKKIHSTN
jgi:hypothetical protein